MDNSTRKKQELRRMFRERLSQITEEHSHEVGVESARTMHSIFPREGKYVLLYRSIKGEVPIDALWRVAQAKGCFICFPKIVSAEGQPPKMEIYRVRQGPAHAEFFEGKYGQLEPPADPQELVPPRRLTMALVPGMGFDGKGRRLGRGAGYFDSLLSDTKPECLKIGIGFKEQLMATELPEEEHDVKMDKLLIDGKLIDLE